MPKRIIRSAIPSLSSKPNHFYIFFFSPAGLINFLYRKTVEILIKAFREESLAHAFLRTALPAVQGHSWS